MQRPTDPTLRAVLTKFNGSRDARRRFAGKLVALEKLRERVAGGILANHNYFADQVRLLASYPNEHQVDLALGATRAAACTIAMNESELAGNPILNSLDGEPELVEFVHRVDRVTALQGELAAATAQHCGCAAAMPGHGAELARHLELEAAAHERATAALLKKIRTHQPQSNPRDA